MTESGIRAFAGLAPDLFAGETNIFMPDMDMREDYNRAVPADDLARFSPQISTIVEKLTRLAERVG